ncbi:MAG: TolC family outer membrane protein [Rhizobacter sp.]|nr:TolC family outer membrane protein [Rhizobacter sp.]
MRLSRTLIVTAIALLSNTCQVQAQSSGAASDPLRSAVEKALLSNPEVASRFNAYRAAGDAVDVARGALRPRVDLNASVGIDKDKITSRQPESESLRRTGLGLSLTQLLWDGLGTQREIDRVSHDRLSRYFDLLEATEQTTLEATRAHYDVLRFQRLVALAEDNYVQHRYASQQIQSRFRAGVGRGVDLEQANARLALAESNLTTEVANLHDVMARYLRVIGEAPPKAAPAGGAPTVLTTDLPASSTEVLNRAVLQSPAISASVEAVRAARTSAQARESAFQPRIEARVRSGFGNNFEGVRDQKHDSSAELVLNWNLYSGGSDQARVRQQVNLVGQAEDLRDKACRDVRQTAAIAFNDTRKLTEQLVLLDRNTLAIEKARDAYRQQFDIGQRSLLDLLNSENELYTARRAYANAEYDRALAFARTHAGMSQLTAQLGIARPASLSEEAKDWTVGEDAPGRCPADAITMQAIDFQALARRVPAVPEQVRPTK